MDDLEQYLTDRCNRDPEFKKLWRKNAVRRELIKGLIAIRIKSRLTQKELAKKAGTSQSAIARLESGRYNPSLDFLMRIGKALNRKISIKFY